MIRLVPSGSMWPTVWHIAFRRSSPFWWAELLAFGRYKHVMCFGFVPAVNGWLFYDFGVNAISVAVAPDEHANRLINEATDDALVVRWTPPAVITGTNLKAAFLCTSAVAHLTGVPSCALRPDAFLRDCLKAGAEIVIAEKDEFREERAATTGAGDRARSGA